MKKYIFSIFWFFYYALLLTISVYHAYINKGIWGYNSNGLDSLIWEYSNANFFTCIKRNFNLTCSFQQIEIFKNVVFLIIVTLFIFKIKYSKKMINVVLIFNIFSALFIILDIYMYGFLNHKSLYTRIVYYNMLLIIFSSLSLFYLKKRIIKRSGGH